MILSLANANNISPMTQTTALLQKYNKPLPCTFCHDRAQTRPVFDNRQVDLQAVSCHNKHGGYLFVLPQPHRCEGHSNYLIQDFRLPILD